VNNSTGSLMVEINDLSFSNNFCSKEFVERFTAIDDEWILVLLLLYIIVQFVLLKLPEIVWFVLHSDTSVIDQ